jgi:hypothetical protein
VLLTPVFRSLTKDERLDSTVAADYGDVVADS